MYMAAMVVVVVVASRRRGADAALTHSSAAHISQTLSQRLALPHGCYIKLQCGSNRPRFFRVVVDSDDDDAARNESEKEAILVDIWPVCGDEIRDRMESSILEASLQVISPARLRVAQYVTLSSATAEPPNLPLAMAKVLLKKTILHTPTGVLSLLLQGVDYGMWRYTAYYKARSGTSTSLNNWLLDAGIVTDDTMIAISPFSSSEKESDNESLRDLPGLGAHGQPLRNLLALAMDPRDATDNTSVMQPRSILLHGQSGSGKTTLVRLIAKALDVNLLTLDCSILATPHFRIEDVFTAALRIQPCLIVIEDLELLFPRAMDETKYKLVCRFVACLERIRTMSSLRVAVVGNVTTLRALNAKIHQVFEEELALEVPDKAWTVRLLESLLPTPQTISEELKLAAAVKFGQRPSNIVALVKRLLEHDSLSDGPNASRTRSEIERFGREIATVSSSTHALRTSVPDVQWTDIGGLANVKQNLLEMVVWPLEKPEVFLRMGITPPLGMLLYGPPGTGKTMLAKAAARASGCNFLNVAASDLMKAEFGESEKAITRVFDTARALSPCMVFIDEFQSLFGNRTTAGVTTSRMISQLLMEMDALKALAEGDGRETSTVNTETSEPSGHVVRNRVFVLAATNALNAIDPAFLQPGRFENILHVGLPSMEERHAILLLQQKKMPWHNNIDVAYLAKNTDGANAASIVALCQAAAIQAMQRNDTHSASQLIEMQDFVAALKNASFDFSSELDGDVIDD